MTADTHAAARTTWEAIIKVNATDAPERRARDIHEGLGYACALLMDEYGWPAEKIADALERITDELHDQEAMRS